MNRPEFIRSLRNAIAEGIESLPSKGTARHRMIAEIQDQIDAIADEGPDEERLLTNAASSLFEQKQYGAAQIIVTYGLERDPENLPFQTIQAKLFLREKKFENIVTLLENASERVRLNTATLSLLAKAHIGCGNPVAAIEKLEPSYRFGCTDPSLLRTLTKAYLQTGRLEDARIALRTLDETGKGRTGADLTNDLGKAYLKAGQEIKAIPLLQCLHDKGHANEYTTGILGHAYVMTKDRNGFDGIKQDIGLIDLRDYMDAKLCYMEGHMKQARQILAPYLNRESPPRNMIGLYMASTFNEDGIIQAQIKAALGTDRYNEMRSIGQAWQRNEISGARPQKAPAPQSPGIDGAFPG